MESLFLRGGLGAVVPFLGLLVCASFPFELVFLFFEFSIVLDGSTIVTTLTPLEGGPGADIFEFYQGLLGKTKNNGEKTNHNISMDILIRIQK